MVNVMIPAKLKALNEESDDEESEEEEENLDITKEALEQKAQLQYRNALHLQRENKLEDAEYALCELLGSDIMASVVDKVKYISGKLQPSLSHLKYCCLVNLGNIRLKANDYKQALDLFLWAIEFDDTDLNLWNRIGNTALKITDLNMAVNAYIQGLKCSPNHWPSVDSLITALYAIQDYMSCLVYISEALSLDASYLKAIVFRDRILKNHPALNEDFAIFHPELDLRFDITTDCEDEKVESMFLEAENLRKQDTSLRPPSSENMSISLGLLTPLPSISWLALGTSLLRLYKFLKKYYPSMMVESSIDLNSKFPKRYKKLAWSSDKDVDDTKNSVCGEDSADDGSLEDFDFSDSDKEQLFECGNRPKRRKASPTLADQLRLCDKRRSARNRTTTKNSEQNLARSLRNVIPAALLSEKDILSKNIFMDPIRMYDESLDCMDIYRLFESQEFLAENTLPRHPQNSTFEEDRQRYIKNEGYFGTEKEKNDVQEFMNINHETILEILYSYLCAIASKWNQHWPLGLSDLYIVIYKRLWGHGICGLRIPGVQEWEWKSPSLFNEEEVIKRMNNIKSDINVTLLYGELLLDQWFEIRAIDSAQDYSLLGQEFNSLLFGDISEACIVIHNVIGTDVMTRFYWLETLFYVQQRNIFSAFIPLETLKLKIDTDYELRLPNMKHFYIISTIWVQRLLNTLQRNQGLSQVEPLFIDNRYEGVITVLSESLRPDDGNEMFLLPDGITIPRYQQYNLLLESYWEIKDDSRVKDMLQWCEVACYEAFTMYRKCYIQEPDTQEKSAWAALVVNSLRGILWCLETAGNTIVSALSEDNLTRLVQTVSNLLCHQMEATDQVPEIIVDVITPWLVLYHIISYSEDSTDTNKSTESTDMSIPMHCSLLILAHDYLGKRNWCCFDDGALLFYMLDCIQPIFEHFTSGTESSIIITQQIDQIFYCLYSHPFKRNKARHVQDHTSLGIALTWNRAVQAYQFYKLKDLPSFDSVSRVKSISADTESLFDRIIAVIPSEKHPSKLMYSVTQYINGIIEEIPTNDNPLSDEVGDLFYLMGDYYFKNKILNKALTNYMLDVCINPKRADSWAAMALARGSQLEMKLNSCETIRSESEILKKTEIVCRCYKTALKFDYAQPTLWIEYGVFAYSMHAFCSRILKQETTNMSLQMFEMLESRKEELLKTSLSCFNTANKVWEELTEYGTEVQDERWLHYYMLGKIAEKMEEKPNVFLEHYLKAAELLYKNGAEYPERVNYASPQYYSVEALEVHYRAHATILKMLDTHGEKPLDEETLSVLTNFVDKFSHSKFATNKLSTGPKNLSTNLECTPTTVSMGIEKPVENPTTDDKKCDNSEEATCKNEATVEIFKDSAADDLDQDSDCIIIDEPLTDPLALDSNLVESDGVNTTKTNNMVEIVTAPTLISNGDEVKSETIKSDTESDDSSSSNFSTNSNSGSSSSNSDDSASDSEDETVPPKKRIRIQEKKIEPEFIQKAISIQKSLTEKCLIALTDCSRRFPEHYKSFYRLCFHYLKSKHNRNVQKARELLLEPGGLFADRKFSNFFSGIWRIPTGEIDRPGSFAFHMARCVHLLMDILRDTRDYKMLMTLSIQLKVMPEPDKKYLRDNEREQLVVEVVSLCASVLRKSVEDKRHSNRNNVNGLLLHIYKCYIRICKHFPHKESIYAKLLVAEFRQCTKKNITDKWSFEQILQYCKSLNASMNGQDKETCDAEIIIADRDSSKSLVVPKNDLQNELQKIVVENKMKSNKDVQKKFKTTFSITQATNGGNNNAINTSKIKPSTVQMINLPKIKSQNLKDLNLPQSDKPSKTKDKFTKSFYTQPPLTKDDTNPNKEISNPKPLIFPPSSGLSVTAVPVKSKTLKTSSANTSSTTIIKPSILSNLYDEKNNFLSTEFYNQKQNLTQSTTVVTSKISSKSNNTGLKMSAFSSKSISSVVVKDRPNLVITPVERQTLQQKLAAKQFAIQHTVSAASSSTDGKKQQHIGSAGSGKVVGKFDIRNNPNSGLTIMPVPVMTSNKNFLPTPSKNAAFSISKITGVVASSTMRHPFAPPIHHVKEFKKPSQTTRKVIKSTPPDLSRFSSSQYGNLSIKPIPPPETLINVLKNFESSNITISTKQKKNSNSNL